MAKLAHKVVPARSTVEGNYHKAVSSTAKLLLKDVKQAVEKTGKSIDEQQTKALLHSLIFPIFAIDKQDIGSIYDVLKIWKTIQNKLVSLVESNHSISNPLLSLLPTINPKLSFSPENLSSIESGVKAFYRTMSKSTSVQLNLFIAPPQEWCLNQFCPPLQLLIAEYLGSEYAIYKAGQIKELLQRATWLDSRYSYYMILVLNIFEKNDLLRHQDQPEVRETIKLANELYTKIGYKGKLDYACKLYSEESSSDSSIYKLGITAYKLVELAAYLNQCKILDYIKVYAGKGEWKSPYGRAVEGYTDEAFLRDKLEPFCGKKSKAEQDEVLKATLGLCFEAINEGVLSKKHPDPSCSIFFAKHNKQLMQEILEVHPEYFVSTFITSCLLDNTLYFKLYAAPKERSIKKACFDALQPLILGKIPQKDIEFFQFVNKATTFCCFSSLKEAEEVLEDLNKLKAELAGISTKFKDDGYILKMIPPEFSEIADAANIMRIILKNFLSETAITSVRNGADCTTSGILVALEEQITVIIGANDNNEGLVF